MISAVVGAFVLALQAAAPVDSASPAAPAPAAAKPAKVAKPAADADRVVCREEPITGSHLPKRVCLPKSEWDAAEENGQTFARDAQDKSRTSDPPRLGR